MANFVLIKNCRICGSKDLEELFSLGKQAFSGIFVKNGKVPRGELNLV